MGSLYIPPVAPENLAANRQQSEVERQVPVSSPPTPRWMAQKPSTKDVPEWVREDNAPSPGVQRVQAVQTPPSSGTAQSPVIVMNFQLAGSNPNSKVLTNLF